jgi:hypothetical protein
VPSTSATPASRLITAIGTVPEPPPVNGSVDCMPVGVPPPPEGDPCRGNVDPPGFAPGAVVDDVNDDTLSGSIDVVVVLR